MAWVRREDGAQFIPFAYHVERSALLLDHHARLSSSPVGLAIHPVAHGDVLRQRGVRSRCSKILWADVARTRSRRPLFGVGCGTTRRSKVLKGSLTICRTFATAVFPAAK